MKIIILNHGLHMSGVSKALVNFANSMAENGFDVTIKIEINNFELKKFLNPKVKVSLFVKEPKLFGIRIKGFLRWYELFLKILKILPASIQHKLVVWNKYDIEISFNRGLSAKIISGSTNKNSKKYVWVHSDYMKCANPIAGFKNQTEATSAYLKYDKIICVSKQSKESFIQKYGIYDNIVVCENILDENHIQTLALENFNDMSYLPHDKARPKVIAVGRLSEEKGYDILLNVCKKLNDTGHIYDLYIVGDGHRKNDLIMLKNTLNLENVHFLGQKLNPYKYLSKADIYVSSSIYEALSTTTIEALILGIPVIVTDCTGMSDILDNGKYGVIVDINSEALFLGLSKLISNELLRKTYANLSFERGKYYYKEKLTKKILDVIGD